MSVRPRALFLAHRIPYPPNKGDKIRSWHLLNHLCASYDVALGCFVDDDEDLAHREVLEEICDVVHLEALPPLRGAWRSLGGLVRGEPLSAAWYRSAHLAGFVAAQRSRGVALEVGFSGAMATYLEGALGPTLLDLVDADSQKFAAYGKSGHALSRLINRREAAKLMAFEVAAVNRATCAFLTTPEEADIVRGFPGVDAEKVDWFRNGIDTAYWRSDADFAHDAPATDLIFTGAMDYRPNAEAILWFAAEVWPELKARRPNVTLAIVGARPTPAVKGLGEQAGITVTGAVPDMRPFLAAARLAIAPLQIARGVQNKVLEGMAMGLPMVVSSGAHRGSGAEPGEHLLVADNAKATVDAVTYLLGEPEVAMAMGEAAASHMRATGGWRDALLRFDAALGRR